MYPHFGVMKFISTFRHVLISCSCGTYRKEGEKALMFLTDYSGLSSTLLVEWMVLHVFKEDKAEALSRSQGALCPYLTFTLCLNTVPPSPNLSVQ